ncbi:uncharacterized protein PHLOEM PROTEIN 2-LIKE A4 isoform X2 [Elaeis guineensis]|uniref:uncharacterized protein PHLOEM PROTEIN 2-LIKE A4 isoform X2 n=1 Tax=Elaeis guineensis var. tenera TaxID=51953 RepID=UPI003C6D18E6
MSHQGHAERTHSPHWTGHHHSISAKALDITWGNDERFWQWVGLDESRLKFQEGAELIQVNWVEVKGKLEAAKLSPSKTYEVFYIIKFKADAFGWHSSPITFEVKAPHGNRNAKTELLEPYRKICNVWHEVHGGEFTLTSNTGANVEFGMSGDGSGWWKGGMILGGIMIKPKS